MFSRLKDLFNPDTVQQSEQRGYDMVIAEHAKVHSDRWPEQATHLENVADASSNTTPKEFAFDRGVRRALRDIEPIVEYVGLDIRAWEEFDGEDGYHLTSYDGREQYDKERPDIDPTWINPLMYVHDHTDALTKAHHVSDAFILSLQHEIAGAPLFDDDTMQERLADWEIRIESYLREREQTAW